MNEQNMDTMGQNAKRASRFLRTLSNADKNALLLEISSALIIEKENILSANLMDIKSARETGLKETLVERLTLNDMRFTEMIEGIQQIISLKDPIGEVDRMWINDAGLNIGSKRVPLGVIGIIYESRPNVTIDAAILCLKTGNAVILKGGSDALQTNIALMVAVKNAMNKLTYPSGCIQLIESADRAMTKELLEAVNYIDCIIPRGGAGLIKFVAEHSKVPIIETGTGNCHIYVDEIYDIKSAVDIIVNAKVQRPGACNAVETVLVHKNQAEKLLPILLIELFQFSVEVYICNSAMNILKSNPLFQSYQHLIFEATEIDWQTEYLDYKVAIKVVDSIDDAIEHIELYSTKHSEAILTDYYDNAQYFLAQVDSSTVYVNASTRFTDGNQFGFGAEIGISTQKLHARGPMGLNALTTIKYVVYGDGQCRI